MSTKKVFPALDAAPVVLYAKKDADSQLAYPLLATSTGMLMATQGLSIPDHDQQVIDEADPNNITITYKFGGATVAVKTIAVSGTTTTITMSYA